MILLSSKNDIYELTRVGHYAEAELNPNENPSPHQGVEDVSTVLKVGDEVEAKFIGFDRKSRGMNLSIKAKDQEDEAEAVKDYNQSQQTTGTTLGDLLKEQMDSND